MAMLKHEEIFREQVYELHRLYQTQKLLMKNISSSRQRVKDQVVNHHNNILDSNKKIRQCFDLEIRPNDQEHIAESVGQDNIIEDETELELTLGLSSYNRRRKIANSDSAPSFSSSNSTGSSSQIIKPSTSARNPRNDLNGHKWGLENFPVSNPSFQLGARQSNPNVEEQFRQDSLNNPPWLFQVLSLNMT